jgi:hypothetical protein
VSTAIVTASASARRRGIRPPGLAARAVFCVCQKIASRPFTCVKTNWERASRGRSSARSPPPRYANYPDPKGRGWRVVARFDGAYSERCIAHTDDESLAGRIASVLNQLDPDVTLVPPRRRRFDWL